MPTDPSGTVKGFILGVDLDGVVGDYTAALRTVVAERTGVDPESLPLERSWDFREWGLSPEEFEQHHRAAVLEHRIFRTMPVMPGAAEARWRLSDAGVWIRIITHRLYVNWGHATAVADTVAWLGAPSPTAISASSGPSPGRDGSTSGAAQRRRAALDRRPRHRFDQPTTGTSTARGTTGPRSVAGRRPVTERPDPAAAAAGVRGRPQPPAPGAPCRTSRCPGPGSHGTVAAGAPAGGS